MALVVNTQEAGDVAKADPFGAGCVLMMLGMERISKANVRDAMARAAFVNALDFARWGKPSITVKVQELIGVSANVTHEPQHRWAARITKHFMQEYAK